ncbi:MAG: hypothetical protein ABIL11_12160 [Chloroflexota bacterium]
MPGPCVANNERSRLPRSASRHRAACRSVHPVNVCVGGFYRWPDVPPLKALLPDLEWGLEASRECVRWAATLTAEHLVRAYDPCISCATHFLKLKIEEIKS